MDATAALTTMPIWDPTLGLGDPRQLDAEEALLSKFDSELDTFAKTHNATKQERFHGAPNRRIDAIRADGVNQFIFIQTVHKTIQIEPITTERLWIGAGIWLDESGERISYPIPQPREFKRRETGTQLVIVIRLLMNIFVICKIIIVSLV